MSSGVNSIVELCSLSIIATSPMLQESAVTAHMHRLHHASCRDSDEVTYSRHVVLQYQHTSTTSPITVPRLSSFSRPLIGPRFKNHRLGMTRTCVSVETLLLLCLYSSQMRKCAQSYNGGSRFYLPFLRTPKSH